MILDTLIAGQSFLGTLPQWIAAAASAGIFGALLKFGLGWRSQTLNEDENLRKHYAEELQRLTKKLDEKSGDFSAKMQVMEDHYRKLLDDSDRRHDECQKDRDNLRREMNDMHDEIAGLKRQIARYSADRVVLLGEDNYAPEAKRSAQRVRKIVDDEESDK